MLLIGELRLVPVDAVGLIGSHAGVDRGLMHAVAERVVDRAVRPIDGQLSAIQAAEAGDLGVHSLNEGVEPGRAAVSGRVSGERRRFVDLAGGVEDGVVDSHVSASVE